MPSQPSSSPSSEGTYHTAEHTAEEDHHLNDQGPSPASSIIAIMPNRSSESVYTTAKQTQTPSASPYISGVADSSSPFAAEYQGSFEALGDMDDSLKEGVGGAQPELTAAPGEFCSSNRAEANTHIEKQRASVAQQTRRGEPEIDIMEYGISVPMPETEGASDSPTGEAIHESSPLYPSRSVSRVNDGPPTSSEDTSQSNNTERREASETSYTYRPVPIDAGSQQHIFLSTSLPLNNRPSVISTRCTDTHQVPASIAEDEMPYEYPSGRFIMNPGAPVFVPSQSTQPALEARNPQDWLYSGSPLRKPGQVTGKEPVPHHPYANTAAPESKVQIFGSGHGMFFDPRTNMFTGDGTPRPSPYRADGTLPSKPDPQTDFFTKREYPEPAEDQLHIQTTREYTKRMAKFGKKGPIQTFRVGGPMPQGNQQATRVVVGKEGEGSAPGRRMRTREELEAGLARLMGPRSGEKEEEGVTVEEGVAEGEEAEGGKKDLR